MATGSITIQPRAIATISSITVNPFLFINFPDNRDGYESRLTKVVRFKVGSELLMVPLPKSFRQLTVTLSSWSVTPATGSGLEPLLTGASYWAI